MIRMPWCERTAPNVMIEVTESCNIECRACYKQLGSRHHSLLEIANALEVAERSRPLHTITLSGGEPTLHPELPAIVRMVKERGAHVFLLTNGVLVTAEILRELRAAGLDSVLFHVDLGQSRPDLPARPGMADIARRVDELAAMAVAAGIDASMSATLYDEESTAATSDYFLKSRDLSFLFLGRAVPRQAVRELARVAETCIDRDIRGTDSLKRVVDYFRDVHGIEPFGFIPATRNGDSVWVSFFVPYLRRAERARPVPFKSTWIDRALMQLVYRLQGRHIHKTGQAPLITGLRVVANAVARLRPGRALGFVVRWLARGTTVGHKMIVYDDGPYMQADGKLGRCEFCPTAIVRGNRLVPCCEADIALLEVGA